MDPDGAVTVDDYAPGVDVQLSPEFESQHATISQQAAQYLGPVAPYNQTLAIAANPGWNVQYTFVGNYVALYGVVLPWISGDLPVAHYAVDGDFEQVLMNLNISVIEEYALFYKVDNLVLGQHTITVNVTRASPDNPWLFDFLRIAPAPTDSASQTASSTTTTGTTTSISAPTSLLLPTSIQASSSSGSSGAASPTVAPSHPDTTHSFPTVPVVVAIAGGIVLITALLALLYYLWKRARRVQPQDSVLEEYESKGSDPLNSVDPRIPLEYGTDAAAVAADILPTLPPGKEPPLEFPPTMRPHPPSNYPNWSSSFDATGQQQGASRYITGSGPEAWGHSGDTRGITMYSDSSFAPQWESQQWPGYAPGSGQYHPGDGAGNTTVPNAYHAPYGAPTILPRVGTKTAPLTSASVTSLSASMHPASLPERFNARSATPGLDVDAPNVSRDLIDEQPELARAPSAMSLAPDLRMPMAAAGSRTDFVTAGTPSDSAQEGSSRMLGGMVTYDGKEARLTTVTSADAVSPVRGRESEGGHEGAVPPPAYMP